jgi:hypothetical protein
MPPNTYWFDGNDGKDGHDGKKRFSYRYFFNDDVPDSLNDDNHFIMRGEKGEDKPELEQEITGKNGEKIFIYKRKLPKEEAAAPVRETMSLNHVKVYPNPADGKISLSFMAKSKGDLTISITDEHGKEVFTDKQKNFSGEYSNQVDLTKKAKGPYFVKITQGDESITKKIIVE